MSEFMEYISVTFNTGGLYQNLLAGIVDSFQGI
jgi:hypothetical protein